jgi:signal transduction histidine kinase
MPEAQRNKFIDNLLADTLRLRQLVNRLLELARADAIQPSRSTCRLREVINELISRFSDRELEINYAHSSGDEVLIAPEVLEMALYNLLENSVQHGANKVEIRAEAGRTATEIYVQDNGSGISAANRAKIFTPFFTTKRDAGGTGLGLAITASLLKAYKGRITLLPSENGVVFLITLA